MTVETIVQKILKELTINGSPMKVQDIQRARRILGKDFEFYGIKTNEVEKIIRSVMKLPEFDLSLEDRLIVTEQLFQAPQYEASAGAIILLQHSKKYFKDPSLAVLALESFEKGFETGLIDSWPHCDSLCMKVIYYVLEPHLQLWDRVANWRNAEGKWQRRASLAAFVKFPKNSATPDFFLSHALALCRDDSRIVQKAIGWLLKDTYKFFPKEVMEFLLKNKDKFLRKTLSIAIEKVPKAEKNIFWKK